MRLPYKERADLQQLYQNRTATSRLCSNVVKLLFLIIALVSAYRIYDRQKNLDRNKRGWVQNAKSLDYALHRDWVSLNDFYLNAMLKNAKPSDQERCNKVIFGETNIRERLYAAIKPKSSQEPTNDPTGPLDEFIFHTFFKQARLKGKFLVLSSNASRSYPSDLLVTCFGWAGVVISERPMEEKENVQFTQACVSPRARSGCVTLDEIFERYDDVIGRRKHSDDESPLNLAIIDLDGQEADLMGCADLKALVGTKTKIQLWLINKRKLDETKRNLLESSMSFAGFVKMDSLPETEEASKYDLFVMLPNTSPSEDPNPCLTDKPTCSFSASKSQKGLRNFKC